MTAIYVKVINQRQRKMITINVGVSSPVAARDGPCPYETPLMKYGEDRSLWFDYKAISSACCSCH